MASVEDRWFRTVKKDDGSTEKKVKTDRHGSGRRWLVRWRDPAGKPRALSYIKKADADAKAATVESDKIKGTYVDVQGGRELFGSYATTWLANAEVDASSRENIAARLRRYVEPHPLWSTQLGRIRPSTLQAWMKALSDHGGAGGAPLSPATVGVTFGHVKAALSAAVDDELIHKNPAKASSVRPPKIPDSAAQPWSPQAVADVRAALPDRAAILVSICAGLGLRQGEAFGLSPDDVDWLRGWVMISRQVKVISSRQVFAPPKGGRTRRIPLPSSVRDELAAHLSRYPAREVTLPWGSTGSSKTATVALVTTGPTGSALHRGHFNFRTWKTALKQAGIPSSRANGCHALRHTYASTLLDAGESIKAVSEYLGHSSAAVTLRVYAHVMPASEDRTRAAVDVALASRAPGVHQGVMAMP